MKLLKAEISDIEVLMPLIQEFYEYFKYPFEPIQHRTLVQRVIQDEKIGSIWLIFKEETLVGYLILTNVFTFEFGGTIGLVDEFFIIESFRNKGFGAFALQEIQKKVPQLALEGLLLQTEKYNQKAKKLYESIGFRDLERNILLWKPQLA